MKKTMYLAFLSTTLLLLTSTPSYAWVYPDCTKDLNFERFGPRVDRVLIRMYADETAAFTAFENGEFDMVDWRLTRYFLDRWSVPPYNNTIKIIPLPPPGSERGYYILDMNNNPYPTLPGGTTNPAYPAPTSVSSVRHAIAHCIDRDSIATIDCEELAIPMYTLILPYMTYWLHPEIRPGGLLENLTHPYNVTEAARLLAADGFIYNVTEYAWRYWDGKPKADGTTYPKNGKYDAGEEFQLVFYGRSDHTWRNDIAIRLSAILVAGPIKIDVDLHLVDRATCVQRVMDEKDFHMYTGGWIFMGPEPDYLYDLYNIAGYWHPGRPPNYGCYNCTEFNYWSRIVKSPNTVEEAKDACRRAQEVWATPCCIGAIPLVSTALPKAFARAYTGGTNMTLVSPDDGENKYRGLMWKDIVNELGFGENSYWTKLNAHPAGYEMGDCEHMTLRYGFQVNQLDTLNILYGNWYWDMEVLGLIYDTLMMRDPNTLGDLMPWLAKSLREFDWMDLEDGKIKTGIHVQLKTGIEWSDNIPLTADDIEFTFYYLPKKLAERGFPQPWWSSYVWPTAKSVYIIDPSNIVILYNDKSAWAKFWVGVAVPIMPKHVWKPIVDTGDPTLSIPGPDPNYIGTGPFKLAEYVPDSHILLVKNTNFFQWCPIDVDVGIDAPPQYKNRHKFPPGIPANELEFTIQINNLFWNQCRGSNLWIDKYVYFGNETGEYLLPGYPKNIRQIGRMAFLQNLTTVNLKNPVGTVWEQIGGCPMQWQLFQIFDWEDNCNGYLDGCDKVFLECWTYPDNTGWYHVETLNSIIDDAGNVIGYYLEVAWEDKEHISLADLPPPYNTLPIWPKGSFYIKVAVHIKGPSTIMVYKWTWEEFMAGLLPHYEPTPNPWVCQWINRTIYFWVTIPEDINLDCKVNILDAILLAGAFGAKIGTKNWNAKADINGDNTVNILDAIKLANKFGWG